MANFIGGKERPVCYVSRILQPNERNLHAMEQELLAIIWGLEKFREYIYGVEFTLFTDNSAIWYLNNLKSASKELMRWALSIQSWNITFRHCPGKEYKVADYLSRNPEEPKVDEYYWVSDSPNIIYTPTLCTLIGAIFDLEEVKKEQRRLGSKLTRGYKDYYLHNGMLCIKKGEDFLIVLSEKFRGEIMYFFHDVEASGHLGQEKTIQKISSRFTWKGLRKDVVQYVKMCEICQRNKQEYKSPKGLLQHVKANNVFEIICVDFLGPYPTSSGGRQNQFLLVVVSAFSHWVEMFPMRRGTAAKVAEKLEDEVFCRFGAPRTIISDNGTASTSKIFDKWLGPYDIREITSPTSYLPDRRNLEAQNVYNLKPYYPREEMSNVNAIPDKDIPHVKNVQAYEPPATRKKQINFKEMLGMRDNTKKGS